MRFFTIPLLSLALLSAFPLPSQALARVCGRASFYGLGDGFAGRTTASGETMRPSAMTTAHRTLPFGTRLLVTNQSNGRQVVVRVSDRGPFVGDRVLDLSSGAFTQIAPASQGVANVCYRPIA
jgi:rare lipoprotein A